MRAATILFAFTFAVLALACGFGGQAKKPPKKAVTLDTLPWTVAEANENLKGMTKEEVIALLGKPSDVWMSQYYYYEPKYIKPDIGDRDQTPGGMTVYISNDNTVNRVEFSRR